MPGCASSSDRDEAGHDGRGPEARTPPDPNRPAGAGSLTPVADTTASDARKEARAAKWAVDRLDGRERRFSIVGAFGAVLFGVLIYVSETHDKSFRLAKGQLTPQTTLILGIVCGALLLGATYLGRRAPVGFVALFTFLMFGTSTLPLGLPFLVLAAWLLYRSYKAQKEATAKLRAARSEAAAAAPTRAASRDPACGWLPSAGHRVRQEGAGQARGQQALHAQAPAPTATQAVTSRAQGDQGLRLIGLIPPTR